MGEMAGQGQQRPPGYDPSRKSSPYTSRGRSHDQHIRVVFPRGRSTEKDRDEDGMEHRTGEYEFLTLAGSASGARLTEQSRRRADAGGQQPDARDGPKN